MTEDNQNNEFKPQPLPGQVFIRPGIDDRPDYEKTLTPEAKAAMRRLSVQQHPRIPEASNERPETQAARIASEGGAPLTAAAHLDVAVPNLESSFLDLRDPMTAPDGTRPTAMQANRLVAGFALGSMLLSAPMAAFNTVLIPQTVSCLSGINRVTDLAMDRQRQRIGGYLHGDSFRMRFSPVGRVLLAGHAGRVCDGGHTVRRRVRRTCA